MKFMKIRHPGNEELVAPLVYFKVTPSNLGSFPLKGTCDIESVDSWPQKLTSQLSEQNTLSSVVLLE